MSWWSSVVNGVKAVSSTIGNSIKWVWNNIPLSSVPIGVMKFAVNTAYHSVEYVLASRTALPDLITKPRHREIANGVARIFFYEVVPGIAIYSLNNFIQQSLRDGHQEDPWLAPYSVFLSVSKLVDYGVIGYCFKQGVVATAHVSTLLANAGSSLNSHKSVQTSSLCIINKCTEKRYVKGWGREPFINAANETVAGVIAGVVDEIPYIGFPTSFLIKILFRGRYVTRLVTPERCDRDKAMELASVLSIGLPYEVTMLIVDYLLERTIGMPPFLYYKVLSNLLLLLHINMAAHVDIPLVLPEDSNWFDPFNLYEGLCRFIADVIFAGLMKAVPIYFKPNPDEPPLIPLLPTLKLGTKLLNRDLEKKKTADPGRFNQLIEKARCIVVPPCFQSIHGLTNDPIFSIYWKNIRQGVIGATTAVESIGKTKPVAVLAWSPKLVARAVNLKFGIPKKVTLFVLMLTKEKDFWDFMAALRLWFERHGVDVEIKVDKPPMLASLNGSARRIEPPSITDIPPTVPVSELRSTRSDSTSTLTAPDLIVQARPSQTPQTLFGRRGTNSSAPAVEPAANLFSSRHRNRVNSASAANVINTM